MQIGHRLYYLKTVGNVVLIREERDGVARDTSVEEDFTIYEPLRQLSPDAVDYLQLELGEIREQLARGYMPSRVNPETKNIEWSLPVAGDLEQNRTTKIEQLNWCYKRDVEAGFQSAALGMEHMYPSDAEARENLQLVIKRLEIGEKQALTAGIDLSKPENRPTFPYLTIDAGPLPHNLDQLEQVFADGVDAAGPALEKFRTLRERAMAATSNEDLQAIQC
ncbi:hypothetical protein [Tumebacillus permanentifrigoris]|uniref:Uncharacterized protein n=1 Tax=Tumebacillus permanentifrigoris TaxID=378543 RepID=A0A316DCV4_9BACL|nr:hypothetical protein [Tumebacillus permanentifrigoris]PWK16051.1 hypothetical protein C7459_102298 [Tumebacillus permanentifrigoris]